MDNIYIKVNVTHMNDSVVKELGTYVLTQGGNV